MPAKIARLATRPPFWTPEVSVAVRSSRQVEPQLLFQLLMGLLANPTCLDGGSQSAQIGRSRQIGKVVFFLA